MPDQKDQSREGIRIHGISHDGDVTGKEEQKASMYMAWFVQLLKKNRFYHRKTGFKVEK